MRKIFDSAIGFIRHHRPARPGRFVTPYLVGALTLLLILGAVQINENHDQIKESRKQIAQSRRNNAETRRALCALRADLEQRIDGSRDFLRTHPQGAFGVSAASIRVSVEGQERTVAVLSHLSC